MLNSIRAKIRNSRPLAQLQHVDSWMRELKIGQKLNLGFGALVLVTFLVIGRNYLGGRSAEIKINQTQERYVPTALTSAQAQEHLQKMLSDIRAYLATGEPEYRYRYHQARQAFEANLVQMESLSEASSSPESRDRLDRLKKAYAEWKELPDRLIELREDLLDNQPALKLLDQKGQRPIIAIEREIAQMLDEQELRSPSVENTALLRDMADFQSLFALLVSSMQSYLVTRAPSFRFEYNAHAQANENVWKELLAQRQFLSPTQQSHLDAIAGQRQDFMKLPEPMFAAVEGEQYRQDLYLFHTKAEPLAGAMLTLLDEIVANQESILTKELYSGSQSLSQAQWQTLLGGIFALGLGLGMAIALRRQIAHPIKRLTAATSRIKAGDLGAKVPVETKDEVGQLAESFNDMAAQLKASFETLEDRVKERTAELAQANEEIITLNERLKEENLRMGAELDVARQIQMMILPRPEELKISGLDLAGYMEPADEVGGDYYDVLHTDGVVTMGMGDVTGHGLESGILMLMTQTAVRTLQEIKEVDPVVFLDTLNRTIYKNVQRMNSEKSLTLVILNYFEGKISISGQHEETILVRKGGEIERIDTMDLGFPIGLDEEIADFISHTTLELQPGDGVVLYTDGIPEAKDINKVQYGVEKLCEVISQNWHKSAGDIKEEVIADLRRHIGIQKVFDDITLLVLKREDTVAESLQDKPKVLSLTVN